MTKKKTVKKKEEKKENPMDKLPKEIQEQLKDIKGKIDKFQTKILEKFDNYIVGVSLLPPPKPKDGEEATKDVHLLVLVDDSDSKKMSKMELKEKLSTIIAKDAEDTDKKLKPQVVILSEVWQNCYDAKYDLLKMIGISAPLYDRGMLGAIKIAEIHKQMVLQKFEKYIVSYVLAGSLVTGRATPESDIDVWVVIDDTDVKKMTRAELKDKLRAIILGMGIDAGEITGIKNKINIQTWLLTDFWDGLREAHPVYFTSLRDGIPFYDRGIFMPWKQLLRMGKIKPSTEAIDMFMRTGEQTLQRVKSRLKEIGVEDFFWSILTPSQAALMLYGIPPPAPKETPEVLREVFVKKEKFMTDADVKILEKVIATRKDIEHGKMKDITGKDIDDLYNMSEKYLAKIKTLFSKIETLKEKETLLEVYDHIVTVVRDILRLEGVESVKDADLKKTFKSTLVEKGLVPAKFERSLEKIFKAKADYDAGKLKKTEVTEVKKVASELIKFLVEYLQRRRGKELEKARIRVKYGDNFGEVFLLGESAFIIHDIDADEKQISTAKMNAEIVITMPWKMLLQTRKYHTEYSSKHQSSKI
jgi:predicted nucleotidyltransferase/uncharacterized protein (UPF0332 family)